MSAALCRKAGMFALFIEWRFQIMDLHSAANDEGARKSRFRRIRKNTLGPRLPWYRAPGWPPPKQKAFRPNSTASTFTPKSTASERYGHEEGQCRRATSLATAIYHMLSDETICLDLGPNHL